MEKRFNCILVFLCTIGNKEINRYHCIKADIFTRNLFAFSTEKISINIPLYLYPKV